MEFFSSLAVKKEISNEDVMTDKFMRFRLGGRERERERERGDNL